MNLKIQKTHTLHPHFRVPYKSLWLCLSLFFLLFFDSCQKSKVINIYVGQTDSLNITGTKEAPFLQINDALTYIVEHREDASHPVVVHLMKGQYYLDKPLTFTPRLSNVTVRGEVPNTVSIYGAKQEKLIWKKWKGNIWVADSVAIPDFAQLYIDGKKQLLARYPNYDAQGGAWQGHAADAISKERVASWTNPIGGVVHAMHSGRWGDFHYQITGVDKSGQVMLQGGFQNNRPSDLHKELRMVENIFDELDSPQEWYFDKETKKLYLWPQENVNLAKASVSFSTLKELVIVKGTEGNPVENVHFEAIHFSRSKRTFMEQYHPLLRSDWCIYRGGALFFDGTKNCTITDCEFSDLGGNVIFINGYNRDTHISGNHIYDCGASAICFVGDTTAVRSPAYHYRQTVPMQQMDSISGPSTNLYPADCIASDNLIHHIGEIEKQVAGVQISMSMNIQVMHNSIYDVPRAGINISEGTWGGHKIIGNDVFDTVLETSDHGSFNSWGRDRFWNSNRQIMDSLTTANPQMPYWDAGRTTEIAHNRFRCDHGWDIDLDDGSSNYYLHDNLCLNGGIKLREGFGRVVENNIMINNSFHPHVWFKESKDKFRHNIVMTKYFPVRLLGWGDEVDFNQFPDSAALALAQKKGTDIHSIYGNPQFVDPAKGDFQVSSGSPAFSIGFKNFPMDQFGVQKASLKAIARTPIIPALNILSLEKDEKTILSWKGMTLKNIESEQEMSAYGLFDRHGVIIVEIKNDSPFKSSGLNNQDVIVQLENVGVNDIAQFIRKYQEKIGLNHLTFTLVRNQKKIKLIYSAK